MDWTDEVLAGAIRKLDRLYGTLRDSGEAEAGPSAAPSAEFEAALADDLNTPKAIAALFATAREANACDDPERRAELCAQLRVDGALLGLLETDPDTWFTRGASTDSQSEEIEALVTRREEARARRDFREADEIRDRLAAMGVAIEDGADGTRWRRI